MIVIVTKTLCYHQVYVADELYKIYGDNFAFVQMREPLDWRVANKQEGFKRPYLISYVKNPNRVRELIKKTDVLIYGEAPLKLVKLRNKKCLLMKMSENIYKDTLSKISLAGRFKRFLSYKFLRVLTNNTHSYLLSCGGFAYTDYYNLGIFKNRSLKWGYFPFIPPVSEGDILEKSRNDKIELIWVSRLIKCKNPLYLIDLVTYLRSQGFDNFHITVVGNSDESDFDYYSMLKKQIEEKQLFRWIQLVGKVPSDKVFDYYKKANIALFTADKSEGWSIGINEAMSCGCAIVCSNTVGAGPYLIDKNNGIVFQYNLVDDFCFAVETLLKNRDRIAEMSIVNLNKINETWNFKNAANNLSIIINNYLSNKGITPLEYGPCSKAEKTDYEWYKK